MRADSTRRWHATGYFQRHAGRRQTFLPRCRPSHARSQSIGGQPQRLSCLRRCALGRRPHILSTVSAVLLPAAAARAPSSMARCHPSHCPFPGRTLTALALTTSLITTSLPASASGKVTSATRPMETCLANGILALLPTSANTAGRTCVGTLPRAHQLQPALSAHAGSRAAATTRRRAGCSGRHSPASFERGLPRASEPH